MLDPHKYTHIFDIFQRAVVGSYVFPFLSKTASRSHSEYEFTPMTDYFYMRSSVVYFQCLFNAHKYFLHFSFKCIHMKCRLRSWFWHRIIYPYPIVKHFMQAHTLSSKRMQNDKFNYYAIHIRWSHAFWRLLLYSLLSKAETYMLDLFVNVISQTKFQLYATKKQSFPIDPHYKKTPTFGNVTYIHNMPKVFVFTKRVRILWRNSMSFVVSDWNSVSDYIKTRRRISCKLQLEMTMNEKVLNKNLVTSLYEMHSSWTLYGQQSSLLHVLWLETPW